MRQRIIQFLKPTRFKTTFFIVGMVIIFFIRFAALPVDLNKYYTAQNFGQPVPVPAQLYMNIVDAVSFPHYFFAYGEIGLARLLCPSEADCSPFIEKMPVWASELFYVVVDVAYIYLLGCLLVALCSGFVALTKLKNRRAKQLAFGGLTLILGVAAILYQLGYDKASTAQVKLVVQESAATMYLETKVTGVAAGQDGRAFCGYAKYSVHQVGENLTQYLIIRCRGYGLKDGKLIQSKATTTPIVLVGKSAGGLCKAGDQELPCVPEYGFAKPYTISEHKIPATGKNYGSDVRKLFPKEMWQTLYRYEIVDDSIIQLRAKAYFGVK